MSANPGTSVITSVHSEGVIFLHAKVGHLFAANATGARIWKALGEKGAMERVVGELSKEYDLKHDVVRADVNRFLEELAHFGLIDSRRPR